MLAWGDYHGETLSRGKRSPDLERPRWTPQELDELAVYGAARLAEAPLARIPGAIQEVLTRLGTKVGIDRATVCVLSPDRRGFEVLVSWSAPTIPRLDVTGARASASELVRQALRGEIIRLERIDPATLQSEADRRLLERNQQKSMLGLPLRVSGGTVGVHLLGGVKRRFAWPRRFITAVAGLCPVLALGLERLRINDRLQRERTEHQDTQRITGVGHWRHSFASGISLGSPELYRMFQLDPRTELDPLGMLPRIEPVDRVAFERHIRMLLCGNPNAPIECKLRRPNGEIRWIRCWGEISSHPDGSPGLAHGVFHDITDRKRGEEAIEATSGRLVRAQEEERTRLGRELHDDLGQRVAALTISVGLLAERANGEAPQMSAPLAEVTEQLSELGSIVRSLSHSLHPAELRRLGLGGSLASLCRRTSMLTDVDVELQTSALPDTLSEQTALAVYRVAQEALSNSIRHGQPGEIMMEVGVLHDCLRLTVTDDGAGFTPATLPSDGGLGMLGMQERMRLVGGALRVHSESGVGTIIEATVPLPEAELCQPKDLPHDRQDPPDPRR